MPSWNGLLCSAAPEDVAGRRCLAQEARLRHRPLRRRLLRCINRASSILTLEAHRRIARRRALFAASSTSLATFPHATHRASSLSRPGKKKSPKKCIISITAFFFVLSRSISRLFLLPHILAISEPHGLYGQCIILAPRLAILLPTAHICPTRGVSDVVMRAFLAYSISAPHTASQHRSVS